MESKRIHDVLATHPFFAQIDAPTRELICGCGRNVRFKAGEVIAREGQDATTFYAIREGRVAVQLTAPGRGTITITTLEAGDILGWSWLFPPYVWLYDVVAVDATRAVEFDGACLRGKCEENTAIGYDLMKRFTEVFVKRIAATRMQILDIYGPAPSV